MTTPRLELAPLLHRAMLAPYGLLLRSNDPARAKAQLYARRAELVQATPELSELQIRTSPFPDGDLVLIRSMAKPSKPVSLDLLLEGPTD